MDSNNQPLDLLQVEGSLSIPSKKIIRSAGAGIISMILAILLLVGLANMDEQSGLVLLVPLLLVVLGLIIPIWMFVRSVMLLIKKQNRNTSRRTLAILLTIFLGFTLLLLLAAVGLYMGADRQAPF